MEEGNKYFRFIVNKNLEKIDYSQSGLFWEDTYALVYDFVDGKKKYELLNTHGEISVKDVGISKSCIEKLDQNIATIMHGRYQGYVLLDYDFNPMLSREYRIINFLSRETNTYILIHFDDKIEYYSIMYGNLTYWFDAGDFEFMIKKGKAEETIHKKVDCEPKYLKLDIGGAYLYRISNKAIVVQKADGQMVENDSLSLDNLYLGSLFEKLLKNMEK